MGGKHRKTNLLVKSEMEILSNLGAFSKNTDFTISSIYFLQNVMKMDIDGSYKSEIVDLDRQENIAQ